MNWPNMRHELCEINSWNCLKEHVRVHEPILNILALS